jgi:hypothetical protein
VIPSMGYTYKKFERKNIVVQASQTLSLDLRLEWSGNLGTIGDDDSTILRTNRARTPKGPAPRTRDGKPDLTGVWNGNNDADPAEPSALAWAETIAKARLQRDNPSTLCLPDDLLLDSPNVFEIIQTPKKVLFLAEYNSGAWRQVFVDGRGHPKEFNPSWMGHSIGRWEGDTLVVDTAGFNDKGWVHSYPHTENLHVVARYRRPDFGHLDINITVEDPSTFIKPWKVHTVWDLLPGEELQEYVCNENNKDPQHMDAK